MIDSGSKELIPVQSAAERLIEVGVERADLTIIYNSHGGTTDAELSASYIEPDSLVFLEGYTTSTISEDTAERFLGTLNHIRLAYGKEDAEYQQLKSAILEDLEAQAYAPTRSEVDFAPHRCAILRLALEKDCVVSYADYRPVLTEHPGIGQIHNEIRESIEGITKTPLIDIEEDQGLGKAFRYAVDRTIRDYGTHDLREKFATFHVFSSVGAIDETQARTGSLNVTDEGRRKTYVVYGTAHAKSLTEKFEAFGARPSVVEVRNLPKYAYIDSNNEAFSNNLRRRLGHGVLSALNYTFLNDETAGEIDDESYDALAFLNGSDRETTHQFLIRCLQVIKARSTDEDKAFKQYESILREIIPNRFGIPSNISEAEE